MQALPSSALGAPVETQAASDAHDRQPDDFEDLRRAAAERINASQRHRMGVLPGLITARARLSTAARVHETSATQAWSCVITFRLPATGHKDPSELRTVNLHKTGPDTKKLIVQKALNTEDMDQERFLTKVRQRLDR